MENLVSPPEKQDSYPTPKIRNTKRLSAPVAPTMTHHFKGDDDSPRSTRSGGKRPRPKGEASTAHAKSSTPNGATKRDTSTSSAMLLSPRWSPSSALEPRIIGAYVDATGQVVEVRDSSPTSSSKAKISADRDCGPIKPERSTTVMLSRWSQSCSNLMADSTSASDALNLNVKRDRANYQRRRFLKLKGPELGMSQSQH